MLAIIERQEVQAISSFVFYRLSRMCIASKAAADLAPSYVVHTNAFLEPNALFMVVVFNTIQQCRSSVLQTRKEGRRNQIR